VTFAGLTDDAFNQIRQYGRSDVAITIRLLEAIEVIAEHTHNEQPHGTAASCHHDRTWQPRGDGRIGSKGCSSAIPGSTKGIKPAMIQGERTLSIKGLVLNKLHFSLIKLLY
jgi:hypothetical protein